MSAQPARHVITPLILLDWLPTFWTLLSVSHNPSYILTFVRILCFPCPGMLTTAWSMRFLSALKAERVATFTLDVTDTVFLILNTVVASLIWTPSDVLVIVCV